MARSSSLDYSLAKKYAKALLISCESNSELDNVLTDVTNLRSLLADDASLVRRLSSPYVLDEVFSSIFAVFTSHLKLNIKTQNFLKVLRANARTNLLVKSLDSFISQYRKVHNIITVKITANGEVPQKYLNEAEKVLQEVYAKNIAFEFIHNAKIIAGFIICIDDNITIDCTANNYIERLRGSLESQIHDFN